MTNPVHLKNNAQLDRLKQNLTGSREKPARKKQKKPGKVIIHVADDVKPETLAALASLAMRVMEMPEDELTEFIKKVRAK